MTQPALGGRGGQHLLRNPLIGRFLTSLQGDRSQRWWECGGQGRREAGRKSWKNSKEAHQALSPLRFAPLQGSQAQAEGNEYASHSLQPRWGPDLPHFGDWPVPDLKQKRIRGTGVSGRRLID